MSCSPPKDIWWWEHWSMKTHFPAGSSCLRTWIGECSNLARIFPRWSRFTKRKNNNWIMNTASPAPTSDWIHLSVDLLCIFSSLRVSWRRRWWKFSKGLWLMLFFYSIIKSYINACCLFSTTIKRCHDADMKINRFLIPCSCSSSRLREGVMKSNEGKETLKRGGVCYPAPNGLLIFAAPLPLSLFTAGWSKLHCFLPQWLTSAFSASSVFILALIFSADRNDFFLSTLALSPKWHDSLSAHCVWADRWRVLS